MKKLSVLTALLLMALGARAEAPSGYYSTCEGKGGASLLTALNKKISSHTEISYAGLWDLFRSTDARADGSVWDMYSTSRFRFGTDQCGNYKTVGDCYNREHSMPKSWFSEGKPMYSDAFHLYPTDGYVNSQRSNFPFGETRTGKGWSGGLGRKGLASNSGYGGTVYEPDDEYKGDFARTYFYMAACYNDRIANWSSDMLAGNAYPAFTSWAVDLLLKWHRQDPVSQKELDRQEAVYAAQHNRNPFIDHPEMAEYIWGDKKNSTWSGSALPEATIAQPVAGATYDLGSVGVGVELNKTIALQGSNLTQDVKVSISGEGFSVSPAQVSASTANSGTVLHVTFKAPRAGKFSATLTVSSGGKSVNCTVKATGVAEMTALPASGIDTDSFTANWSTLHSGNTEYQLHVTQAGAPIMGFPVAVKASDCHYTVDGLEPATRYEYWLEYGTEHSNTVAVTTLSGDVEIQLTSEAPLEFYTSATETSQPATVTLNIFDADFDDIEIRVAPPFELSDDLCDWNPSLTLNIYAGQFFVRINGALAEPGEHVASLRVYDALSGDLLDDRTELYGEITAGAALPGIDVEDGWEAVCLDGALGVYNNTGSLIALQIYTLDGRCLHTGLFHTGLSRMNLAEGVYILTDGTAGRRVVVKH